MGSGGLKPSLPPSLPPYTCNATRHVGVAPRTTRAILRMSSSLIQWLYVSGSPGTGERVACVSMIQIWGVDDNGCGVRQ